jgi:hypothetical protein
MAAKDSWSTAWISPQPFEQWPANHFPEKKDKVLNRVREMRKGRLND